MKTGRILLILVLAALAVFIGLRVSQNIRAKNRALHTPPPEKIAAVECIRPHRRDIVDKIYSTGSIQAQAEVTLFSKVSGKIARNLVQMSSAVQPGQVVAIVHRDEVGYDFKPYEVKSDARGVVSRVFLNPGATVNPSLPLLALVDIDSVKVMASVDEKKIRFIRLGQPAAVTLEAFPGETYSARVSNISPVVNPLNRTVEVELKLPNPGHRLKPGMYAETEWEQARRSALVLPLPAVVERGGQSYVFLAEDGRARMIPVSKGAVVGDVVEITSGLGGEETVISTGAGQLNDKDRVKVIGSLTAPD